MTNESPFRKNRAFYIGVVLTVLEGILSGCSYLSVYIVLTALASGTITAGMVGVVTAGLAVIFLLRLVIYSTGYTQVQIGGAAVSKRLRLLLGDKLKKIPLARFTQGQVGQYVNTMTSDVGSYEKILTHSSGNIIKNAALSAVLVGFVCTVWLPAGLILLVNPIISLYDILPDFIGYLLLFTALNPEPGSPYGVSLLRSMPFLADILLKIYRTIGKNWERAGNVRYAVVCRPGGDGMERGSASERAGAIAAEWSEAMRDSQSGVVRDFVAVGDVSVKVIGADGKILDSETPVRQILEQLVAKTGLPPFMLGLSWASTERMSKQQADLLTSELWAIRRCVQPVLQRICEMWLRLNGYGCEAEIVWDDISLQDIVEEAHAELYRQQAEKIKRETEETR